MNDNGDYSDQRDLALSLGWLAEHRSGYEAAWEQSCSLAVDFLLGYRGLTRTAYLGDLRSFGQHCRHVGLPPVEATRPAIERYLRQLDGRNMAASSQARHLATLRGFYRYAVEQDALVRSPAQFVRRPTVPAESRTTGLSRTELVGLIEAARLDGPRAHVLVLLLAVNGLRVGETTAAEIGDLDVEGGHRVLALRRKGGKRSMAALPTVTAEAIEDYIGGRTTGYILLSRTGHRLDRTTAGRILSRLAEESLPPAKARRLTPHSLRHSFVGLGLDAGIPVHRLQDACSHAQPSTTMAYGRARQRLDGHAAYAVAEYLLGQRPGLPTGDQDDQDHPHQEHNERRST